jgi:hypothetical protein
LASSSLLMFDDIVFLGYVDMYRLFIIHLSQKFNLVFLA